MLIITTTTVAIAMHTLNDVKSYLLMAMMLLLLLLLIMIMMTTTMMTIDGDAPDDCDDNDGDYKY